MRSLFDLGGADRSPVLAAAGTLFLLLAGHTVLEVARDALFLENLPAEQLPFTYLAIAGAAWVAAQVDRVLLTRFDKRRVSALTLVFAAAGTAGFHFAFETGAWWVPHAFYVWIGLVATFAVAQFWRLLADRFTVAEAKRLYAPITAGGSLGAVTGAGLASGAQSWLGVDPGGLLFVGAGLHGATALVPLFFVSREDRASAAPPRRRPSQAGEGSRSMRGRGYLWRLLVLVALTAVAGVLVDYVFKSVVDQELSSEALGPFFGRFYAVLNLVSLVVQLALAPKLLDLLGANRVLVVLPALLAIGAAGAFLAGGLVAAVLLRGADGSLRHSLHRSAVELLYLPVSTAVRDRYKALVDALGQRGGQALGSVGILAVVWLGGGTKQLAFLVGAVAVAWIALTLTLRRRYLDLFRANLRAGSIETQVEVPDLDLHSLESLVASLSSERDEEVLASLELLAEYDRARLIPALLLHHPSRAVVLRALELLATTDRRDFVPVARRLFHREDPEVQAASMRALATRMPTEALRAELHAGHAAPVRAAILVALVARGADDARDELEGHARSDRLEVRLSVARAIRLEEDLALADLLHAMVDDAEPELRRELARAFGALREAAALPILIQWLGPRGARAEARDAMIAIGDTALDALDVALEDLSLPRAVRAHVPRSISRFITPAAARILFDRLDREEDGWVRYKILRGLRTLREALPELRFDSGRLETHVRGNLARAAALLARRVAFRRAHEEDPSMRTRGADLLEAELREKEGQALDRAVRLVALDQANEDVRRISHALRHGDRRLRAESRELLTALAPFDVGPALDALLDDEETDPRRLARVRSALDVPDAPRDYVALLRELVLDESDAVRCIAAHHAGELALAPLVDALEEAKARANGSFCDVIDRALDEIRQPEVRDALA